MRHFLSICFALIASCLPALAQSGSNIRQSGNVTPGHAWAVTTNGIAQDAGTAAVPFLTSIGTVGQGQTICAWTALSTAPGSQSLCFGVFDSSAATITLQNFGIDTPQSLNFVINGTTYPFPYTVGGIVGPNSSTVGDFAEWNNTTGSLLKDVTPTAAIDQLCSTDTDFLLRVSGAWQCGSAGIGLAVSVGALNLQPAAASTIGGIESYVAVTHQWINAISTLGVPNSTQPAFTDISGHATVAQGGTNCTSASIICFNNITGFSAAGTTGTTSTSLVFSTSPTLVTPTLGAASATSINFGGATLSTYNATTWTPTITTDATVGTPAYTTHTGTYEQIGRQVTVRFNITLSGWTGSPTGNVNIAGLPVADADNYGTCVISFYTVTGLAASNLGITGLIADTTSVIILYQNSSTASNKITAAQIGTTANLVGFCNYHT